MVKDALLKLVNSFDSNDNISLHITVRGLDTKTRKHIVSILKAKRWDTKSESTKYPGGSVFFKDNYNYVNVTLYKD